MKVVAVTLLLAVACGPAAGDPAGPPRARTQATEAHLQELDLGHPTFAAPVASLARRGAGRFVVVDVTRVDNSARIGLVFTVSFRPDRGGDVPLGTFSLYPGDHPGRFIVGTRGLVRPSGRIVVAMQATDPPGRAPVRVWIGEVALADR